MRVRIGIVAVLGLLAVTAACSRAEPTASPTTATAPAPLFEPGVGCEAEAAQGRAVRVSNAAGASLGAIELGAGPVAIVLAHQSGGDLCQWLPYGTLLADQGYRVVAFDFAGNGSSTMVGLESFVEDLTAVVAHVRATGADHVALVGASMGGTMSLAGAASITPPVDAVVAVSAPSTFAGVDAKAVVGSLTMPVLYLVGRTDGGFAASATALAEETPKDLGRLEIVDAYYHGVELLNPAIAQSTPYRALVEDFLAKAAKG